MIDWLEQALGNDWKLTPAGGLTGDAFIAQKNNEKLFVKRNTSPFLAVLSAVGIVPKLVWTKRLENGDVFTAQEWLDGRKLTPEDMKSRHVSDLLYKIHSSPELLHMLMRLGKKPLTSDDSILAISTRLNEMGLDEKYKEVRTALDYLSLLLPVTRNQKLVVCHCDLNHNNLLMSNSGEIYLVDWDNASIADPATDFGSLLKWYIPKKDWNIWLEKYGVVNRNYLFERMYWYLLHDALHYISWHSERGESAKVIERLHSLKELNYFAADFS